MVYRVSTLYCHHNFTSKLLVWSIVLVKLLTLHVSPWFPGSGSEKACKQLDILKEKEIVKTNVEIYWSLFTIPTDQFVA